jgi:hypothetical protein
VVIYSTEYCSIRVEENPIPTYKLKAPHNDFLGISFFKFILGEIERPPHKGSIYMNFNFQITDSVL